MEVDQSGNKGKAVHSDLLGDLNANTDGRLLLTTPTNGRQSASLTVALTNGEVVATGTSLDEGLTGELQTPEALKFLTGATMGWPGHRTQRHSIR